MRKSVAILELCWFWKLTLKVCMAFWSRKGIEDSTPFTEVYPVSAHRAIFLLGDRWWQFPSDLDAWWKFLMTFWWSLWQDTNMRLVQKHDINEETREFTLNCWSEYNWNVMLLCCTQLDGADVYGWFLKSCRQSSIQWALAVLWKDFGSYATKTISMVAQIFDNENARFIHLSSNITGTIL